MARLFVFVALALFASAVVADSLYNDKQVNELNNRLFRCANGVPKLSEFNMPGLGCAMEGSLRVSEREFTKEDAADFVVECLKPKFADKPEVVETMRKCLADAMAQEL